MTKTDFAELQKFHSLLMKNSPSDFVAWYFPVKKEGKDPDGFAVVKRAPADFDETKGVKKGSWKAEHARLSFEEATERLKAGENVGISSRAGQLLVIYDRDSPEVKDKIETLTTKSRKRIAGHSFCWRNQNDESLDTNIPTEKGEVRSCDQYVLAPGSFVPVEDKEIEVIDEKLGLYTVENEVLPATISFQDLPDIFLEQVKKNEENMKRIKDLPKREFKKTDGKKSALFELTVEDIIGNYSQSERFAHPLHASDTSANFSVSNGLGHCWRHLVSLNAIQFLCVKADYLSCEDAGTGHKGNPSSSAIIGNDEAIFVAWKQAKEDGLIPEDDPAPFKARKFVEKEENFGRPSILVLLASKRRDEATERMVEEILETEKIYTTRDDEKAETWIYREGIYIPQARTFIKEFCRNCLGLAYTTSIGNQVIAKIEADTYIDQKEFFQNKYLNEIAVENGILNITTKELTEFTPDKIFFNKIPVVFDPKKECPNVIKHFEEVLRFKEDVKVMQEIMGYLLYKDYPIEKAFMFIGDGRNGKGKTLDLMKRYIGIENCTNIPLQQLEIDLFSMGELFGKLANLSGDIDKKALKNTGAFKNLTGRDLISASRKFKTKITFTNYAKLIFCANELPRTEDTTIAFFDRWILLEFPYTFITEQEMKSIPEEIQEKYKLRDPNIIEKISTKDELSGLLNWSIGGLNRLISGKDFSYSKNNEQVKEIWIRKSDSFTAFVLDCIQEEYSGKIKKQELKTAYVHYCKAKKLKPTHDREIKSYLLSSLPITEERESSGETRAMYWSGIKFKEKCGQLNVDGFSLFMSNNEQKNEQKKSESVIDVIKDTCFPLIEEKNILHKGKNCLTSMTPTTDSTIPNQTEEIGKDSELSKNKTFPNSNDRYDELGRDFYECIICHKSKLRIEMNWNRICKDCNDKKEGRKNEKKQTNTGDFLGDKNGVE